MNKMTLKYTITQCMYWIGFCLLYAFSNSYLNSLGFSAKYVGIVLALGSFFSVIMMPYIAKIIEKYYFISIRKALITNFIICSISAILIGIVPKSFIGIIYVITITTLLNNQSLIYSFIFEYINKGVNVNFNMSRGIGSLSFATTSYIAGYIGSKIGFKFIPYVSGIFLFFVIFHLLSYEKIERKQNTVKQKNYTFYEFIFKYDKFIYILIAIMLLLLGHTIINTFMLQILKNIGGTDKELGIALMIAALVELPTMTLLGYIAKKTGYVIYIKISAVAFSIKLLFTIFSGHIYLIYLAQFIQILGYAIYTPSMVHYINDIMDENDRVSGQAYAMSAATFSSIIGNLMGGKLIDTFGVLTTLIVTFIISSIGTIIMIKNIDKMRSKDEKNITC